jgi:hypothetical protein
MTNDEGRSTRILVAVPIVVVVAADALYVAIVVNQDPKPPELFTLPFIAAYLALMAVLLAVSLLPRWSAAARTALRAAVGGGLLVLGLFALMSIGLPLLIAGGMAAAATVRTMQGPMPKRSSLMGAASAVIAVAVLIAGFEVTGRMIVCPSSGSMSGGGSAFLTGPYYYDCVNGHLNFHSGSCNSDAIDENGNVTHPGC